jgi:hypothetical protein
MSRNSRQRPERTLGEAVEEGGDHQQGDGDRGAGGQRDHGVAQAVVVGAGEHEEGDVRRPHDPVDQREGEAEVAEGIRHAERDEQQRRDRPEHHQPHRPLLGVEDAGQPGIAGPGPPEHSQHEQPLGQSRPARVV